MSRQDGRRRFLCLKSGLIRRNRQAFAARPIEFVSWREHRHSRRRAVGEFSYKGWTNAVSSEDFWLPRFGDAITGRLDCFDGFNEHAARGGCWWHDDGHV